MTFNDAQHPRGQAGNPGQFRVKTNAAPDGNLTVEPSPAFTAANDQFHAAQEALRHEVVREMVRSAPAGATAVHFELYSEGDPEAEMLAFSHFEDEAGEEIEISRELSNFYYDLASRVDYVNADEYGFVRDGEMFSLDIPPTDPAHTAPALQDAIELHRFVTFNASRERREETNRAVHTAAANHIRAIASKLHHPVAAVVIGPSDGIGMSLSHTENAAGEPVHDHMTRRHPSHAADRELLEEISFAASNIRNPAWAGLAAASTTPGHYSLPLNP